MNIQSAMTAGRFLQWLYSNWQCGTASGLNGFYVLDLKSQPVVPTTNYKVVATIYCNDLATDLHPQMPGTRGWKIIGIVAVNENDANDIFLVVRGTENIWEYIEDAKFFPKPFSNVPGSGLTDDGFTDMYQSFSLAPSACEGVFIADLIALLPATARITMTGHSLGGSLATLFALDLAAHAPLPLTLYTFASPRVGDLTFHKVADSTLPDCFRIVNRHDIVPQLPPPLLYSHVGDETELIPGQAVKWTVHCEHHLSTYLNLLAQSTGDQESYPVDTDCTPAAVSQPSEAEQAPALAAAYRV